MKFLAIAIIGAIVSATSVTAQGDRCSGKSEQDCIKDPGCQETYGNPRRSDGSDFHTSNAPLIWDYTGCYEPKMMNLDHSWGFPGMEDPFNEGKQQQGQQQENNQSCSGKSEQECKDTLNCEAMYGNPQRSDGSNFHTSNADLKWQYTGCYNPNADD
ncbi:hypothetical protein O0I10_010332 [Lichtheimia ornata]|uniref:Secreted protein n=1 Tax=Lichtheimia ornata TaxID=688661 RepID=A0AAD7UXL2_9FUNG|nr:uncharacterized protein O0I10_010332 [Lichtheimia ornata]KAJ8653996.1 hypothetical protein O0I10_010332 [Lichtheimia ornata]